jgi:hypothetical protein
MSEKRPDPDIVREEMDRLSEVPAPPEPDQPNPNPPGEPEIPDPPPSPEPEIPPQPGRGPKQPARLAAQGTE